MTLNTILFNIYPYLSKYEYDNTFFKEFKTPQNEDNPFNRKEFMDNLMSECGDFDVITSSPEIFLKNVSNWTATRLPYWTRIWNALSYEYNPLWNYNRYDEGCVNQKNNRQVESTNNSLEKLAGYNSGELVENAAKDDKGIGEENDEFITTNDLHSYGNIGVTTTQKLLREEIELAQVSLHDMMLAEFKEKFLVLIY